MQIELNINGTQKRCNLNSKITPNLINKIRGIEFKYFYQAAKEFINSVNWELMNNEDYKQNILLLQETLKDENTAYTSYLNTDIVNDRCFKKYQFDIIVPIIKFLIVREELNEEQLSFIDQDYAEVDDNFWYNQLAKVLIDAYTEIKKNIA